jgi:aspartate carbamoyltransferase catalytic subunit
MTTPAPRPKPILKGQHLLGIEGLSAAEITALLDLGGRYVELNRQIEKKQAVLRGRTQINLFFEASTRTQSSFELAGKRLGADVMNMSVSSSAMAKGETVLDTAMTLNAMHPDILVVRHHASGAPDLLAQKVGCAVINAGDGQHEHPTQALLDALTIRNRLKRIEGLTVAICGDVLHSRVARSNILLLGKLGARVRLVAPSTLLPAAAERLGCEICRDMTEGLAGADVVMMLRLQIERMQGGVRAVGARVLPVLRARRGQAVARQAGRAGHASGAHEPRRGDRFPGRRRYPVGDPRTGRNGRCGAHGGA